MAAVTVPVEEAIYFVETTNASAVVSNTACKNKGLELAAAIKQRGNSSFLALDIASGLCKPTIPLSEIVTSSDHDLIPSDPGLVIFTSGTTGKPKAALKKRSFFTDNSGTFGHWWNLSENDTVLHVLPVHHSTGISVTFLAPLLSGARIEFGASGPKWRFSAPAMWERWRRGGLTVFSGVPTMYQRMMRHYLEEIVPKSSPEVQRQYRDAARNFRLFLCGTSALPHSLQMKWMDLLGDQRKILERYGGTEFSGVFSVQPGDKSNPDVSYQTILAAFHSLTGTGFCWQSASWRRSKAIRGQSRRNLDQKPSHVHKVPTYSILHSHIIILMIPLGTWATMTQPLRSSPPMGGTSPVTLPGVRESTFS